MAMAYKTGKEKAQTLIKVKLSPYKGFEDIMAVNISKPSNKINASSHRRYQHFKAFLGNLFLSLSITPIQWWREVLW
jgi:hypothetical protein